MKMKYAILVHETVDDVGVAVTDLKAGEEVGAATLEGQSLGSLRVAEDVPLGHKIAMRNMPQGKPVIEYGRAIAVTTAEIGCGQHVHVHNIKTQRW
jgi:(2R)-sulfolactate sulfo-lyase subunit alpha